MYIAQITMKRQELSDRDAASDAINNLLAVMRMNGQVCGKECPVALTASGYAATVLIPERTALDATNHNKYVRNWLQRVHEAGLSEPEFVIAEDMDSIGACECDDPPSYILYTTCVTLESPLRCGGCFLQVPLYRIPPTKDDEYNDVIQWQSYYQACDTLQMNCTPMERSALRQLSLLDSGLTKAGLEICGRIDEITHTPAYYYIHRERGRSVRQEKRRLCPGCGEEWLLPARWHRFVFRCDRCHLLSNIAWDVG